jgi:transcriptional regulator with XRE-family HTH domain
MKTKQDEMRTRAIKVAMVQHGYSLRALAKATRIEYTRLSKIVNGHIDADEREQARIAARLHLDLSTVAPEALAS